MSALVRNFEEKRDYIRMRVDTPALVSFTGQGGATNDEESMQGKCWDLSGGGLLLELPNTLAVGTKAKVEISSSFGHHPMLKALVEVMRIASPMRLSSSTEVPKSCWLGVKICEMID